MSIRKLALYMLVVALCVAGAMSLINGVRPVHAAAGRRGDPDPTRPVWSVRRVPTVIRASVRNTLRERVSAALTKQLAAVVAPAHSCVAVDGSNGALVRIGTGATLAPASTMKLLTGSAALHRLGAGHRFVTRVVRDGSGNLVLVGGGDPLLATPGFITAEHATAAERDTPLTPLADLADAVVSSGVRHVDGALLVDDHTQDAVRFLPEWKPSYGSDGEVGALGALTVDRGFAPGVRTPAVDPALNAGNQLALLLAARGVTIEGGVRHGVAPSDAHEVAHVESQPLSALVEEMLTISDNYVAEELLRALAVDAGNVPGTTAAGVQVVRDELEQLGVPTAGLVMYDGSGLAPADRVSCATMLATIERSTEPRLAPVNRGLPVWGLTGTLARRTGADDAVGRLRAKTGSIDGTVGLVGVVDGPEHVRFAFIANGEFSSWAGEQLQAAVANAVSAVPNLHVPTNLVPAP
jgi:D-alanyl-D-alanine carboxypeptidase/D-alanyl-D-alanine-endopeptidase (penicillin-binding protein 4)